ncbi:MAG TPA: glycosyltransferase [Thermoanaerobaculia bacterium]|nr:glycosyltransferase [Thermoanaerobaculia bacterium]
MRVLIAGHSLGEIGGVQSYERDLASWLLARGHSPVVYATELGDAARQLNKLTVPVVDDLSSITAPIDIIHGDSAIETMAALLHFSTTPAIFVCHGWEDLGRTTPRFPRTLRYVAVDDTCADRLVTREGIAPERISVLLNAVDMSAFRQREPLPDRPRRAVVFGNLAHELTFLPAIRAACRRASIELDVVSASAGTAVANPESILGGYDLAFAKAKCAMEAMACGLAVILCSEAGLGGTVRSIDFDRLRRLNFGIRTLQNPLTTETVLAELALYDADDARRVSDRIRESAPSDALHESLLSLYQSVIDEHAGMSSKNDGVAESRAASAFLHALATRERHREGRMWMLANAAQRVLQVPVVGPMGTRLLRWLAPKR